MNKGKIVQVMGPVVDVQFEGELPHLKDALRVEVDGKSLVMEVSQHIGGGTVRCIMLAASEGLYKGLEVEATGGAIAVPVGRECLGRLFNVVGETIDNLDDIDNVLPLDMPFIIDNNRLSFIVYKCNGYFKKN